MATGEDLGQWYKSYLLVWRHYDIQNNDIQYNDIQNNDIQYNDIQLNDIKSTPHNATQHKDTQLDDIQQNGRAFLCLVSFMLIVANAECHKLFMLSVYYKPFMLSLLWNKPFMLSVIIMNVIMLSVTVAYSTNSLYILEFL